MERKNLKMIRVISSFGDGPVNFNPTGPAEDRTQKLMLSTELLHPIKYLSAKPDAPVQINK